MSGHRLELPNTEVRPSRNGKAAQSSSSIRSPSPYHHLDLFDSGSPFEEPLISFDDDNSRTFVASQKRSEISASDQSNYSNRNHTSLLDLSETLEQQIEFPEDRQPSTNVRKPPSRKNTRTHECGQCEEYHEECYYCNLCDVTYCGKCWNKIGPHRTGRTGPGGIPHEKTDQTVADKLRMILENAPSDSEQDELFQNDQNTAWFGVAKDEFEDSIFHDYGRYGDIMANISLTTGPRQRNTSRFPGLVSFVGETGAGKSTLVKVLIELSDSDGVQCQTPVVGSIRNQDVPTSGDVHLYTDPKTYLSESPILYADCEGLSGGEREPRGARLKILRRMAENTMGVSNTTRSFEQNRRNLRQSEREIKWANTSETQSRQFAVSQLYPRLLFTFSDAVVFVLKNPRVIENVIEKLLEWAAAALEMSSNQPILPCAIIALNASDLSIDPAQWNVDFSTRWLLDSVEGSISKNVIFKKHAQLWRSRGKTIGGVIDLLHSYYSCVRVVRIPGVGRPKLMKDQMTKLYNELSTATEDSNRTKRELRMLLDGDELQMYLQMAFDHFASNLDQPFDFVQASFIYNPIPSDFAGNILKLAVNMMDIWQKKVDGEIIFLELAYMVASCIMLDSARKKTRGSAELIFPEYTSHCDNALEDFCDRYWPCEFVRKTRAKRGKPRKERCVNVRTGHSKGHQLDSGKVFAVGPYESKLSMDSFQETFRNYVFSFLRSLLEKLRDSTESSQSEDQVAAEIHKTEVLRPFYECVSQNQTRNLASHSACFSCLVGFPEHSLPCGHVLCTACLQAYGQAVEENIIEITSCPLHAGKDFRWNILVKPRAAGVRVLTLDGGGIRGIVELEILRLIENVWGGCLRIQDFFDLIVGTSTGGLIALGLASKNWTVDHCIHHFTDLCQKAFTERFGMNVPIISIFVENYHHSKYETAPLNQALQEAFSEDDYLFGGPREVNQQTKVAVTATTGGNVSVLANYNRGCPDKLPYTFQRPEKLTSELKTWEAARATSAAPRIFRGFFHEATKQVYIDGAVYHNNPILVADLERKLLWPAEGYNLPDFVLSIGTAYSPTSRKKLLDKSSKINAGMFSHAKNLATIAVDHIRSSLDSDKTWSDYMLQLHEIQKPRYQRINPEIPDDLPALDEVLKMKPLQNTIRERMTAHSSITSVAHRLIATCFYLERVTSVREGLDGTFQCTGKLKCRLPRNSLHELGRFLGTFHERTSGPYFIVREKGRPQDAQQIFITSDILSEMMFKHHWYMEPVRFQCQSPIAMIEIVLCVKKDEEFPISGFPRMLLQESSKLAGIQPSPLSASKRWRNRTPSQQKRRKKWTQPTEEPSQFVLPHMQGYFDLSLLGTPPDSPTEAELENDISMDNRRWVSNWLRNSTPEETSFLEARAPSLTSESIDSPMTLSKYGIYELESTQLVEMPDTSRPSEMPDTSCPEKIQAKVSPTGSFVSHTSSLSSTYSLVTVAREVEHRKNPTPSHGELPDGISTNRGNFDLPVWNEQSARNFSRPHSQIPTTKITPRYFELEPGFTYDPFTPDGLFQPPKSAGKNRETE